MEWDRVAEAVFVALGVTGLGGGLFSYVIKRLPRALPWFLACLAAANALGIMLVFAPPSKIAEALALARECPKQPFGAMLPKLPPAAAAYLEPRITVNGCARFVDRTDVLFVVNYVLHGLEFERLTVMFMPGEGPPVAACGNYDNGVIWVFLACVHDRLTFANPATGQPVDMVRLDRALSILAHEVDHFKWQLEGKPFVSSEYALPHDERPWEVRANQTQAAFFDQFPLLVQQAASDK